MIKRLVIAAFAALLVASPASAQTVLPSAQIDASGNLKLGPVTLGKRQGNAFTITPDTLQIKGSSSTGDVSGMSVTASEGAPAGTLANLAFAPSFVRSLVNNPRTYGTFANATGASIIANSTHPPQVLGFTTPSQVSTYGDRDSVGLYVDNTAPSAVANVSGTFTTTTFIPTTPLSAGVVAALRVGMLVDTSDATKFTGTITSWATNGSSITVSGWFQQGNAAAGQTPSGPNGVINPITKVWPFNANVFLQPSSYASRAAGFELGLFQNKAPFDPVADSPQMWGFDAVNLGTYTSSAAFISRGDFQNAYIARAGRNAGYWFVGGTQLDTSGNAIPQGTGFLSTQTSGYPFAYQSPTDTLYYIDTTGGMYLGGKTTAQTALIAFRNGFGNTYDARLISSTGTSGAAGQGLIGFQGKYFYVTNADGSGNNLVLQGGNAGSGFVSMTASGIDTNTSINLSPRGSGSVSLGTNLANYATVVGGATGVSIKEIAAGTDTAINKVVSGKSTGLVCIGALSDCGNEALRVAPVASQVNSVQIKGAAAGAQPTISAIGTDTNVNLNLTPKGTGLVTATGPVQLQAYTIASLPPCTAGRQGAFVQVTDATAPSYNGTLTGGGAVNIPAYCNGSTWTAH